MNRAYSILNIRSVDEDQRVIEGVASTPSPDRMSDIVEPMGAKFSLPMPLLWQHQSSQPVGWVEFAKPTPEGIPFKARFAEILDPGPLKASVDNAWQAVKAKLVRAVSIGFQTLAYEIMKNGGYRYTEWEWLELSLVTIPANSEATINVVRSIDTDLRTASGKSADEPRPGVSGKLQPPRTKGTSMAKTISEQIAAFEASRAAKSAQRDAIMDKASEEGITLDAAQVEEYDGLNSEVKSIDEHLIRLHAREEENKRAATVIVAKDLQTGSEARDLTRPTVVASAKKDLVKGTAFTRYVIALGRAKGNIMQALEISKQWQDSTPEVCEVLRSAVSAGTTTDTTWASPLVVYQNMANEFVELLYPMTIIGKINGFRRVPFNVKVPRQTTGASVNWVGERSVKPVSSQAFDQLSLGFAKIAGIVPVSDELLRFSSPSAEAIIRGDLAAAVAQFMDSEFIDPSNAAVTNVSPASVTNGVTPVTATGITAAALRTDIKTLMATFLAANLSPADCVWVMTNQQALAISLMVNSLGQPEFPGVTMNGGTFVGLPVIASENVPSVGDSPTDGSRIVLLKASEIMLADDGGVTIDMSREASLQMDTAPDSPATASTVLMSLWQNNLTAFKVERYINWLKRRDTAVGYINYAKYAE